MKSSFLKIAMVMFAIAIIPSYYGIAGIDSEFETPIITQENYITLTPGFGVTQVTANQFTSALNNYDPADDGYYKYTLPFPFTFNGVDRTELWVCVNGFITFDSPLNLPQANPMNLFNNHLSFQNNVIAPFWGDHYYRTVANIGYTPSNVLIKADNNRIIIEWKSLNINDKTQPSSIGSFQVMLYKSTNVNTRQGDIEFAYGLVNGSGGSIVKTDGASIGIKGASGEYVNGLCFDTDPNDNVFPSCDPFGVQTLSNSWQPSGGSNFKINFKAFPVTTLLNSWGDGDTDLSHGEFGMHFGMAQNRFVTFNDVRKIMRSVVTGIPMDSIRGREAFHADVDHDGRFYSIDTVVWKTNAQGFFVNSTNVPLYYNSDTVKLNGFIQSVSHTFYPTSGKTPGTEITPQEAGIVLVNTKTRGDMPQRSRLFQQETENYPLTNFNQIHFQCDEHDAYWIIDYLAVKIPVLPWIYEWKNEKGKLVYTEDIADNVKFGEPIKQGNNKYKIPVYSNGIAPEGFSTVFNFDVNIEQIEINLDNVSKEKEIFADFHNNRSAVIGSGKFASDVPYAYIYVETENDIINVSGTKFNDVETNNTTIKLNKNETLVNTIDVHPNPVTSGENAKISVNLDAKNYYNLEVYDVFGNFVTTIFAGELNSGINHFNWNGIDNTGKTCATGTYIIRVSNSEFNAVSKIILTK